ncbi:MAG: response regulator [Nitrosospira sp.]|nr:response regulator [Nitrosospira sp.]
MDKSMDVRDFLRKRADERGKALTQSNRALRAQISERERIEEALREAQSRLDAELSSMNRLHELNSRLIDAPDLPSALKEILEAAVALLAADMGTIQLYDPVNKTLTIAAHHGFEQDFLDHFRTVDADGDAACSRALAGHRRVVVEDVQTDERYAIHRVAAADAGYRAVQSTPLFSRDGKPLGMLSTHFRSPNAPAEPELKMLDLYARQAADFVERRLITERLQEADRRKDALIATLSHELRNPLAAIDSAARLMQSPGLDGGQCEFAAQVVQRQCAAMKILLDDLLDVSRLTPGQTTHAGLSPAVETPAARSHLSTHLSIVAPAPAQRPCPDAESGATHAKRKYRILVADDNTAAAAAISLLLQREGHKTKAVYDGRAALEEAARFLPDIALLDIGMPYLNGYEVAREIRAASWGANMRLFAATGWGQEKDKMLAKEAGFDVHMTKPIDFRQLLALIEEHGGTRF